MKAREIEWSKTRPSRWEASIAWLRLAIQEDAGLYCLIVNNDEVYTSYEFDNLVKKAQELLTQLGAAIYQS